MKSTLVALLVLGIAPLFASAATITWTLEYAGSYDSSFNPIADQSAKLFKSGLNPAGYDPTTINVFKVYFQATGLTAGQDIKQLAADLRLGTGLTALDLGDKFYFNTAETCQIRARNTHPPFDWKTVTVPTFASSGDAGEPDDLLGLSAFINADVAYYNHVGEDTPELLGQVYLTWDGVHTSGLNVTGGPAGGCTWVIWTNNTVEFPLTNTIKDMRPETNPVVGQTLTFGISELPEPMTMALLAVGSLAMLRRKRKSA